MIFVEKSHRINRHNTIWIRDIYINSDICARGTIWKIIEEFYAIVNKVFHVSGKGLPAVCRGCGSNIKIGDIKRVILPWEISCTGNDKNVKGQPKKVIKNQYAVGTSVVVFIENNLIMMLVATKVEKFTSEGFSSQNE